MREDEKTARGRHGPDSGKPLIVRTTAPAGTPARRSPVAPEDGALPVLGAHGSSPMPPLPSPTPGAHAGAGRFPSDRPVDTASQPRTVGGHTARLNIAEGALAPPLAPDDPFIDVGSPGAAPGSAPRPPAVEGLLAVTGGAGAQRAAPRSPPPSIPVEIGPSVPMPSLAVGGTMRMLTVEPVANAPQATPAVPAKGGPAAPEGEAALGSLLFTPVSVAVGLVFFALGCIGTLTFETLWGGIRAKAPVAAASATSAPAAPSVSTAASPASSHAAPSAVASVVSPPPVATFTAPPPTVRPSAGVRSPGTGHLGPKPPRGSVFEPKGD